MVRDSNGRPRTQLALLAGTILSAAGVAGAPAHAQSPTPPAVEGASSSTEGSTVVVVTANKRTQNVVDIPYNISAVGAAQIARSNVEDLAALSQQIPNFTLIDRPGFETSSVPIIRGLNASPPLQRQIPSAQSPVGFYIGNSPYFGYFPLDDVQRVEVLRGPQGTLYGAGSLGGTVRVIPNDPALGVFSGRVGGSAGGLAHSSDADWSAFGTVNVPLGEDLAIRASYKDEHDAGFIDQFGIMARQGANYLTGIPLLTNPADVANSTAARFNKNDVNYTNTNSGRIALLWHPTDKFRIELAYNYAHVKGDATNLDNPTYHGGVNPIDGRTIFPATGDYQIVLASLEPYGFTSQLASADLSYELGFATLSATSTYSETRGAGVNDAANDVYTNQPALSFALGSPVNPRFLYQFTFPDFDRSFTQEIRLVSKSGGPIDYVVGGFYQSEQRGVNWFTYVPGAMAEQAAAGGNFPSGPGGLTFTLSQRQKYTDTALFGELTWHPTDKLQVTGGARVFWDTFHQLESNDAVLFGIAAGSNAQSNVNNAIFKLNAAYDYLPDQRVYATFSEGYRRGGANAFPTSGFFGEAPAILKYAADTTKNYEIGLKGRLPFGTTYTLDAFYIDWTNAQIELQTPDNGWPAVVNAPQARSVGAEIELDGSIVTPRLTYSAGFAYADATISKSFCLPAGSFFGVIVPCEIPGVAGQRLPGAPQTSAEVTVNYDQALSHDWDVVYSANVDYVGSILNALPAAGIVPATLPAYTLVNASVTFKHDHWQVMPYVKNLFNVRTVLNAPVRPNTIVGNLSNIYTVGRPLEAAVKLSYNW